MRDFHRCARCRSSIKMYRYCNQCFAELLSKYEEAYEYESETDSDIDEEYTETG